MNIIYRLENVSKQEGPKFYIGSKTNCYVKDGVIFSISTGQPYYGSSANITMINDLKNGDKFVASILEIVDNKDDIISIENRYITEENAVSDPLYYNLSQATLNYDYDKTSIVNEYGETILTVRDSKNHYNKRRTSCRSLGFKNVSSLIIELYNLRSQGKTYPDIVKLYGKNRHFYERIYRSYEVEDFINTKDIYKTDHNLVLKIRELYSKNLSYELISSLLGIIFLIIGT